ncbi:MAG: hypothetical protein R3C10_18045 [Pirellulales bacterium]|nr:hypothetical protein [Planctomycetales bacterium]
MTIPVEGTVTFQGREAMPTNPVVYFRTTEAAPGYPTRPARGVVGDDGELEVTAFERGDGLVPGKYDVMIEFFDLKPGADPARESSYDRTEIALEPLEVPSNHSGPIQLSYTIPTRAAAAP